MNKSYVLHGENHPDSRRRLSELVLSFEEKGWEVNRVDWHNINQSQLLGLCRSQGLLSLGIALVIENFFTGNKKAQEIIGELLAQKGETILVFWEGKQLAPVLVKCLAKDFIIQEFKVPVYVFKFLSSVIPGNAPVVLKLLHETLRKDSADFLFVMLAKHVRMLAWAKIEPKTLLAPPWQKDSLIKQASKFSEDQLIGLHSKLLEIDRKNKRSQLPEDLSASLDLLVASL